MNNKQNGLQDAVINALTTLQEKRYWIKTDLLTQYLNTETKVNITSQVVTESTVTQALRQIYKDKEYTLEYKNIADFTWFHIRTNQQQPAAAPPPVEKQQDKQDDNFSIYPPLPMTWQGNVWKRNAIKRQLARGVYELDRIVEYTGISADEALEIYIEIQPDPPKVTP